MIISALRVRLNSPREKAFQGLRLWWLGKASASGGGPPSGRPGLQESLSWLASDLSGDRPARAAENELRRKGDPLRRPLRLPAQPFEKKLGRSAADLLDRP